MSVPKADLREAVFDAARAMFILHEQDPERSHKIVEEAHKYGGQMFVGRTVAECGTILMTLIADWSLIMEDAQNDNEAIFGKLQ